MTDTYSDPVASNGDAFKPAEHKLALLLISNIRQVMNVETEFGMSNPISCNVAVLDGEHKGDTFTDTYLFGVALINLLKQYSETDRKVLGRLVQGDAKPGRSAPWLLQPATDDEKETAVKYEAYVAAQAPAEPEPAF